MAQKQLGLAKVAPKLLERPSISFKPTREEIFGSVVTRDSRTGNPSLEIRKSAEAAGGIRKGTPIGRAKPPPIPPEIVAQSRAKARSTTVATSQP